MSNRRAVALAVFALLASGWSTAAHANSANERMFAARAAAGVAAATEKQLMRYSNVPEQIHISFSGNATEYIVQWVTFEEVTDGLVSEVQYGPAPGVYDGVASALAWEFVEGRCQTVRAMHEVSIPVTQASRVYYRVRSVDFGVAGPWSAELSLRTVPVSPPITFAIFGDMASPRSTGAGNPNSVNQLIRDEAANIDDFVIHNGDIAYDVDDNCAEVGDEFMNAIQPIAAGIPYMFAPGNHETDVGNSYLGYLSRYHAQEVIGSRSGSFSSQFYSWDQPLIHFVAIDTDAWIYPTEWNRMSIQWNFLREDLARVDRTRTPWIVVYGHRAMYCGYDSSTECGSEALALRYGRLIGAGSPGQREYGLESLLVEFGVDAYFAGHTHHYEREWPVQCAQVTDYGYTNPKSTVHILSGKAGINGYDRFKDEVDPWNAFRDPEYNMSFGRVTVFNATHLLFQQHLATDGSVLDEVMIVQERHGPFSPVVCNDSA